jgi:hypothetical protein
MIIIIKEWYGRLGNNIKQISNALIIALKHSANLSIPPHEYINTQTIIINPVAPEEPRISDENNYFYTEHPPQPESIIIIISNIIKSIFTVSPIPPIPPCRIIIHIRSGDLFDIKHDVHKEYLQPPMSYYTSIINTIPNYKEIIIIAEDTLNPCVNAIRSKYPHIKYRRQSLTSDIRLLLSATTVVESYGTFCAYILLASSRIQTIHRPSYGITGLIHNSNHINIITHDLQKYKEIQGDWKNTDVQHKRMLKQ